MNRKIMTLAAIAAIALLAFAAIGAEMASQYETNKDQDVCRAMDRAAGFLVEVQKPGPDGKLGWSWVVGDGPVSNNVASLAALALLEAYQTSGQPLYLAAARKYADSLMERQAKWNADNLPYKPDVQLLARLSRVTNKAAYMDAAERSFGLIVSRSPTGSAEVERIFAGRKKAPSLLGFDVALGIQAALAVGERGYALQMADRVLELEKRWYTPGSDARWSLLSAAALVEALEKLDAGHFTPVIERYRRTLTAAQQPNGSWLANETQPSAYALLALAEGSPAQRSSYQRGIDWLKITMLKAGSYATFNDFMPEPFVGRVISEVHAEALTVLARACRAK